jgi:pilus assembly protein TadC
VSLAAAVCLAAALLMARPARARLRLGTPGLTMGRSAMGRQQKLTRRRGSARAGVAVVAGVTVVLASFGASFGSSFGASFGPVAVAVLGVVVAVALVLRAVTRAGRRSVDVDVALCIDLLGAAMSCGALPAVALAAVAPAASDAVGDVLAEAATALALGADPATVWADVATAVPALDRAARACARASSSGAGVADELFRLAAVARADVQVQRRRRLERAGVWLVLPLGLCFLPAFVLVAVVPVVLAAVPALGR